MGPVATVSLGRLEGAEEGGVQVFRGVPYAQPPVGPLRWRPPRPPMPWPRLREATAFGPIAPQTISPGQLARSGGRMEEDCLYLNVWTPAAGAGRRPILVFVHGGGMISGAGSSPLLNGARLAGRGDLVVVTLNYRLGPLGVLHAPQALGEVAGETTANLALQDMMAALAFIRREAEAFGGDPRNITVAAQSSGAVAVASLMASPAARGLFDKAILQSGGLERVIAPEDASQVACAFLAALGENSPDALRALPLEAVTAAHATSIQARVAPPRGEFHPFVDGLVVAEHPVAAALAGRTAPIPLLAGATSHEWRTFDAGLGDEAFEAPLLADRIKALLGEGVSPDAVLDLYQSEQAAPVSSQGRRAIGSQLVGDLHFNAPTELFARGHAAAGHPAFHYDLTWESPTPGLGACHNICLPLVFGTVEGAAKLSGADADALAMSQRLQDAWAAFARSGDPSTAATGAWPRYAPNERLTLRIGRDAEIVSRYREAQLALWTSAYPWLGEQGL